jgi:hypothetical protein
LSHGEETGRGMNIIKNTNILKYEKLIDKKKTNVNNVKTTPNHSVEKRNPVISNQPIYALV